MTLPSVRPTPVGMSRSAPIPLIDLRAIHDPIRDELRAAFERVLDSSAFSSGPEVEVFETQLASFVGVQHAVGVGSGTAALLLTLLAAGVGPGDEVVIPANTFFATLEAVRHAGAVPIVVDVLPGTANIDPQAIEAAITPRTAAVIAVHLYGQPVDVDAVRGITSKHGLLLIEDAAQAIGATWCGAEAGSLGDAGAFSFYAGKNLGALGEAGAVTTDDENLARRVRSLRAHGEQERYVHDEIGFNERMDGLQAAFLSVKLGHVPAWQRQRDALVSRYDESLEGVAGLSRIAINPFAVSSHHLYVVRLSANRDGVLSLLRESGIGAAVHYPVPVHLQPASKDQAGEGSRPVAETLARQILSLPLYPGMADAALDRCVECVRSIMEEIR